MAHEPDAPYPSAGASGDDVDEHAGLVDENRHPV